MQCGVLLKPIGAHMDIPYKQNDNKSTFGYVLGGETIEIFRYSKIYKERQLGMRV